MWKNQNLTICSQFVFGVQKKLFAGVRKCLLGLHILVSCTKIGLNGAKFVNLS